MLNALALVPTHPGWTYRVVAPTVAFLGYMGTPEPILLTEGTRLRLVRQRDMCEVWGRVKSAVIP
jgi:hypothetical protein